MSGQYAVFIIDRFGANTVQAGLTQTNVGDVKVSGNKIKVGDGSGIYYLVYVIANVKDNGTNALDLSKVNWVATTMRSSSRTRPSTPARWPST